MEKSNRILKITEIIMLLIAIIAFIRLIFFYDIFVFFISFSIEIILLVWYKEFKKRLNRKYEILENKKRICKYW